MDAMAEFTAQTDLTIPAIAPPRLASYIISLYSIFPFST